MELIIEFSKIDEMHPKERLEIINAMLNFNLLRDDVIDELIKLSKILYNLNDPTNLTTLYEICEIHDIKLPQTKKPITYVNPESVHIFMQDSIQLASWLLINYPSSYSRPEQRINLQFINSIESCLDEFTRVDGTKFKLIDLFASVFSFITKSKHSLELMNRLEEEINEGLDTCTGGHLARLTNVIKGFPNVPFFPGNEYEHNKAKIFHELNKTLDFTDPDTINDQILVFINVMKINVRNLAEILRDYTFSNWQLIDDKIICLD